MYSYYLTPNGGYYEGERQSNHDQEVPRRESPWDTFDGAKWIPGTPVPESVTPLQARRALRVSNVLDVVKAAVSQDPDAQEAFEYATLWYRASPFVAQVQALLAWTDKQVDDLFRLADTFV